jgi:fructokinase
MIEKTIHKNNLDFYGAIEAGGTKFICAIGTADGEIVLRKRIETTTPDQTLSQCVDFFSNSGYSIKTLGLCCFGPVDLNKNSPTYGHITKTPKKGWVDVDICGYFSSKLNTTVVFDTDVNGAAYAEYLFGSGRGCSSLIYVTIGTGIGGGAIVDGKPLHGLMHPEMGHIFVKRHADDNYPGSCSYHSDCLEGLASGPAITARWSKPINELGHNIKAIEIEAYYIAQAVMSYLCILSPQRIILGGGVMDQELLLPMIKEKLRLLLANYIDFKGLGISLDQFLVLPGTGSDAGILGALALAKSEPS